MNIEAIVTGIKRMVGTPDIEPESLIKLESNSIIITKSNVLTPENIDQLKEYKKQLLIEQKKKYVFCDNLTITHKHEKYDIQTIPKAQQLYKLSDWRTSEKIANYHDLLLNTKNHIFGCIPDTETWLSLDTQRALDYLDNPDLNNFLGIKFSKDLNLVICNDTIKPLLEDIYKKLESEFSDRVNSDFEREMGDRYEIADTIFDLEGKKSAQKSRCFINIFKFLFGISGGVDINKDADIFDKDINMNVNNQHKMLLYLEKKIPDIITGAIREDKYKSKENKYRKCCWLELTGNLKTHQFIDIYLKRATKIEAGKPFLTEYGKKAGQRISYLLFDKLAAFILCFGSTDISIYNPNTKLSLDPPCSRNYYGWYFPNNPSVWADGGEEKLPKADIIDNTKDQVPYLIRYREKELEEIMVFDIELNLLLSENNELIKLIGIIEFLIKNPAYTDDGTINEKQRENNRNRRKYLDTQVLYKQKQKLETKLNRNSLRKSASKRPPNGTISAFFPQKGNYLDRPIASDVLYQKPPVYSENSPTETNSQPFRRVLFPKLEAAAAASKAAAAASPSPSPSTHKAALASAAVASGNGIKRKKSTKKKRKPKRKKTKNKKKKPKRKTKQSNN